MSFGIIYAGFGSFCDLSSNQARGWLLGWQESTLAPLAANRLTDTLATDIGGFYLSSIWMSGSGIAARGNGDLFFSIGNSDPNQNTYDGVRNIQESVVKVAPTLVNLLSIFTPFTENVLDQGDNDLGSGGVLLLPAQPGPFPFMDVAAGKAGTMYLLNEASLGGFTPGGPDKALDEKIFGLGGHPFVARAQDAAKPAALNTNAPPHEITGVLEHADGPVLTLRTRAGKIAQVDDSDALRRGQIGVLVAGNAYTVQGTYDSTGALRAQAVLRAKASPAIWPQDR